jgi:RNA polymerase sigma-70 factor (ECF subfamily)
MFQRVIFCTFYGTCRRPENAVIVSPQPFPVKPAAALRTGCGETDGSRMSRPAIHNAIPAVPQKGRDNCLSSAELKGGSADISLVSAIRSGEENAMALLYDRYSPIVYSVALRVLADTGAAEDVVQEVFLKLWRNPGLFDSSRGNLGAWLAVIARNRAIDTLRKRHPETDISDVVVSVEPDMAGDAQRARAAEKVRGALGAMPPAQRSALEMAYFEGLTHTEIAAKTGEPLGTIKTRIRAGLIALRKAFNP